MAAEARVDAGHLADGAANPPGDRRAGPFGTAPNRARPATQAEGTRQRLRDLIQFRTSLFGARILSGRDRLVDLLLQLANPLLNVAAGALVEHGTAILA